jgi:hypothetical protein
MRFSVDGWDPGYGSAVELEELPHSAVAVDATLEVPTAQWAPIPVKPQAPMPSGVLFVDGVRRIEAQIWIDDAVAGGSADASRAVAGICASYAAGVVCCCGAGAHAMGAQVRRRLFTSAKTATHIAIGTDAFGLQRTVVANDQPASVSLSLALQRALLDLEVTVAVEARATIAEHGVGEDNLLIVDGPLRGRDHLQRTLGYIKTHHAQYLPPELNAVVAQLGTGERTPVFMIGTGWDRHTWYLRLPCLPAGPWTGIVRVEAASTLQVSEVVALADTSQQLLGRYASVEYKDGRAPQNLVPIAGLEKELKHRLGFAPLLYREIRVAALAEVKVGPTRAT